MVDSVDFNPVDKAKTFLYTGGNATKLYAIPSVAQALPDKNGKLEFMNLNPGQYILSIVDNKYMPYIDSSLFVLGD